MSGSDLEAVVRRVLQEELARGEEFLTVGEAARLAKYGASTVRRWLSEGRLTRYGKGRASRINRAEFLGFLRSLGSDATSMNEQEATEALLRRIK